MSLKTMTPERLAYVRKDIADPIPRDDEMARRVWAGRAKELLSELDAQMTENERLRQVIKEIEAAFAALSGQEPT
jgi:hypothetical protein